MARKGIKQNKYTEEFIKKVVHEKQIEGKSAFYLATKYGIPEGTIETWAFKYRQKGTTKRNKRGRQKKDENIDYKEKYEILKKYLGFLEEVDQEKK